MRDDLSPVALRQAMVAGLPIPLAIKTLPDRKVILWNQAAEAFLGIPPRDILRTTGYHLLEARAAEDWLAAETRAVATTGREQFRVATFPGPAGHLLDFRVEVIPFKEGRSRFLLLLFEPARSPHALEEEIRGLREEMVSVFNDQRKTFAYLNHQVRTSLGNITGMLERLLDADLKPNLREMGETALISAIAIRDVLDESLDIQNRGARRLSLETVEFDPRRLLEVVIEANSELAIQKRLELACIIGPDVPPAVSGDPGLLREILQTLTENALRGTTKGMVRVKLLLESANSEQVTLRFEFRDLGEGVCRLAGEGEAIAAGRASASLTQEKGTHLEFLPAWNVAGLLGGQLLADPQPEGVSSLSFICPFGRRDLPAGQPVPVSEQLRGRLLLIVHPQEEVRKILAEQWEAWGGTCLTADSEPQAVDRLRGKRLGGPAIDLVILDTFWAGQPGLLPRLSERQLYEIEGVPCLLVSPGEMAPPNSPVGRSGRQPRTGTPRSAAAPPPARDGQPGIPTLIKPVVPSRWLGILERQFRAVRTSTEPEPAGPPRRKVLLVDDHQTNLRVATRILEGLGCEVTTATDGHDALELLVGQPFELVFLACVMPALDGFETARRIRKREQGTSRRIPIIGISTGNQPEHQNRCLSAGMDGFLAKPFKKADFRWALERWTVAGAWPKGQKIAPKPTITGR